MLSEHTRRGPAAGLLRETQTDTTTLGAAQGRRHTAAMPARTAGRLTGCGVHAGGLELLGKVSASPSGLRI